MAFTAPARKSTAVRMTATTMGGKKLRANLRPGPENNGIPARRALRRMVHIATEKASTASMSQTAIQRPKLGCTSATSAASSAVMPIAAVPQPGTAVKELEFSMVRRMYCRSSIMEEGGSLEGGSTTMGTRRTRHRRELCMRGRVALRAGAVKYFMVQSQDPGDCVTTCWPTLPSYIAQGDRVAYSAPKRVAGCRHPCLGAALLIQEEGYETQGATQICRSQ